MNTLRSIPSPINDRERMRADARAVVDSDAHGALDRVQAWSLLALVEMLDRPIASASSSAIPDPLLNVNEAAAMLNVGKSTVEEYARSAAGRPVLKSIKLSEKIRRYRQSDVLAFIAACDASDQSREAA